MLKLFRATRWSTVGFLVTSTVVWLTLSLGCDAVNAPPSEKQAQSARSEPVFARAGSGAADGSAGNTDPAGTPTSIYQDVVVPNENWVSVGHDLANTRNNPLEQTIGPDNVGTLVEKWRYNDPSCVTSTPAVYDGTVYFANWQGHLYALGARDGRLIWDTLIQGPTGLAQTALLSGSPFVDEDRVYIGGDGAQVFAVERKTGKSLWTPPIDIDDTDVDSARIWSSPVVHDNLLVIGNGSYEVFVANNLTAPLYGFGGTYTFHGSVVGLDATTGAMRWRTFVTPPWTFGVSVWSSAAIDSDRGLAFIGTGQSYTEPASTLGDSLLALRLSDGAIVWSAQFTADDVWSMGGTQKFDQDVGAPPNLFVSAGRALVGVGDKGGSYRAFDRDTGKLVWMKQLTAGSHLGGVMGASAYANGSLYVASNRGVSGWLTDMPRSQADVEHAYPTAATVFALNADDGSIRWQSDITPGAAGGVTIANGVVYVPTTDGVLDAFASDDGRLLTTRKFGDSAGGGITVSGGMVFAGWGWDWTKGHPGGFVAYGLP